MGNKMLSPGMIHVYTGNGKGKTTAALGLACRAIGYDLKVYFLQFMKGNIEYGELKTAEKLAPYLTIKQMGRPTFVNREKPDPEDVELAQEALALAQKIVMGGEYDLVILDEINVALDFGLIELDRVLKLMDERPSHVELILTGRHAPKEITDRADLVTEMREVRHYYQKGVSSRNGIEK